MEKIWKFFYTNKKIFSNFRYVLFLGITAFLFYFLNGLIANIRNIESFYNILGFSGALKAVFISSLLFSKNITLLTFIGTIILSLLFGMLITLLVYRFKVIKSASGNKFGLASSVGLFFGLAAPGCAVCGVGLISLLGFSSALAILPFEGKEILLAAIVLLAFSVARISEKLYTPVCEINLNSNNHKKMKGGQH
ncbi:hypothetical protein HYV50_02335 [Candidatus Pacearchaeota archaeon]|nr:hypothetical protein [Candidatus Pacearchaeota archaeon]